jgi:predicted DNA-binding transcriptional regulator AlpA
MSRSLFYELVKGGKGPRLMKIGRRTLISQEAAADWRRAMEAATMGIPSDVAA